MKKFIIATIFNEFIHYLLTDNIFMNGSDFVDRIDFVLKQRNIKRQALADEIGFDATNFTQWKKKGHLPDVRTAYQIAKILNISLDWLLTGELPGTWINEEKCDLTITGIFYRIDTLLREILHKNDSESHLKPETMYIYLMDVVSKEELLDWKEERQKIDFGKLYKIAQRLNVQYQFLLNGQDPRMPLINELQAGLVEKYGRFIEQFNFLSSNKKDAISLIVNDMCTLARNELEL